MVHLQLAKWVGAGENVLVTTPIIIKMTRENSEVVDMDITFTIVMISQIYTYLQTDHTDYILSIALVGSPALNKVVSTR